MELGLLILRLGAGLLFAGHGAQKLFGWFGGGGVAGTGKVFDRLGLRPGRVQAAAAGTNEFVGGLLLAAGLLMPLAAVLTVATMTAAVITVHGRNGPWSSNGGWELNALYGLIAVALTATGPGEFSLDEALGLDLNGAGWGLTAALVGIAGGVAAVAVGRRGAPREESDGDESIGRRA